mgnify:CR=1 FL=1
MGFSVRDRAQITQTGHVELFTGLGLATASGLNAYIPLLAMGLLGRFTNLVELPHPWAWLTNGWVIGIVAVLLVVEVVADKVPALDSINDTTWIDGDDWDDTTVIFI